MNNFLDIKLKLLRMSVKENDIINQTRKWVNRVVIGLNFCPFAYKVLENNSLLCLVSSAGSVEPALTDLLKAIRLMDNSESIETILLIFNEGFYDFDDYLDLVDLADALIEDEGYEGVYQVASFHPDYVFEDSDEGDAANFTNRSPYPMLHLLRESSLEKVLENFSNPEEIPQRNVRFSREKGLAYMQVLLESCKV